jgi:Na+/proline symporter
MKIIGRPPSFSEAMKREVVRLVSQGFSVRLAARSVGCAEGTIRYARKRDPQFAQEFEQGQADREMELLRIIREAAKDPRQWRAGAWWLERMFPERYAPCKGRGISAQQLAEHVDQFFDDIEGRLPAGLHQSLHSEFQRLMRKSLPGKFDHLLLDEEPAGPADGLPGTLLNTSPPQRTAAVEFRLSHAPEFFQLNKEASSVLQPLERPASATELEAIVPPQVSPQIPPPCAKSPGPGRHGEVGRPAPNGAVERPGPKGVSPQVSPQIPPPCAKSPGSGRDGEVGRPAPNGAVEEPGPKGISPQVSPQIPPPCAKSPGSGRDGEVGRPAPNGAAEEPGPKGVSPQVPPSCGTSSATGPPREAPGVFGRSREWSRARAPPCGGMKKGALSYNLGHCSPSGNPTPEVRWVAASFRYGYNGSGCPARDRPNLHARPPPLPFFTPSQVFLMDSAGFGIWDWMVLVLYFVGCTALGLWVSRKVRTSGGYFLGDRKLPWWIMVGQAFGTGTNAENPVAQTGATFQFGFATIWTQWKNMLITPFYWLMAPWYRRSERTTIAEIIEDRYGRGLALFYTLFGIAFFVFNQGAMLLGAAKIISVATGAMISPKGVVVAMTVTFILYSFFGGLRASAYTDFMQGFLIIVLSFMLIPAGLAVVGGFTGMRETLATRAVAEYANEVEAKHSQDLREAQVGLADLERTLAAAPTSDEADELAELVEQQKREVARLSKKPIIPGNKKGTEGFFELYNQASGVDLFTILMLTLNGLIGITAQPHILAMNATGRSERAGRVGQTYGSLVKRFCTIGWALTGLIVAALVVQQGACLEDKENAFGYASLQLLPTIAPGLMGLMVACVLAANMSTCSTFMVNIGALFARNLYQNFIRPQSGDKEILWVGRLSGLALTGLGVVFALTVKQVLDAFMFTETIAALMGIMLFGGILWKRANRYGAALGTLAAFLVYYALNFLMTHASAEPGKVQADTLTATWAQLQAAWSDGRIGEFLATRKLLLVYPWTAVAVSYAWATLAGFTCLVLFSLATPCEDPKRIEQFFDNMRRSTDQEGLPEGYPKPLAADCGQDLLLLDLPGWLTADRWKGFLRRYREDLIGFVLAWGMVGLLVLSAWGLMQVGK